MRTTSFTSWMLLISCVLLSSAPATATAQSADLGIIKSGPDTAAAGADVTYSLSLQNNGPDDAVAAQFDDPVPTGMTFVSAQQTAGPVFSCSLPPPGGTGAVTCSIPLLPSGAAAAFSITLHIPPATAPNTFFLNSAAVSSQTPDPDPENDTGVAGTLVPAPQADVAITKTGPSSTAANTDISYSITVSNLGPDPASNVSWSDTLPAGSPPSSPLTFVSFTQNSGPAFNCGAPAASTTCTIATLAVGATASFTFVGHVPSGTAGTTYTNVASVTSDNDPDSDNDSATSGAIVSSADVGVIKSGPATANAGGATFDYVITLSNSGPDPALSASFDDPLPSGVSLVSFVQNTGPAATCNTPAIGAGGDVACAIGTLLNGQSAQFTVTVAVDASVANGSVLTNTVTAATSSVDANSNNNSSTVNTVISAQADLSVSKTGPATVNAGTNASYTLTLTNNGPSAASSVTLSDTLPPGETFVSLAQASGPVFSCTTGSTVSCNIASLATGATAIFTLVTTVGSSVADGTVLTNTATTTSSTADPTPSNNNSMVMTTVQASADLALTKTGPAAASAGTTVSYALTLINNGPSAANAVTLSDTLPVGETFVSLTQTSGPALSCTTGSTVLCSVASLAPGASASFTLTAGIDSNVANGTVLTNTATGASSTTDPTSGNNSSTVITTVQATADLALSKTGPSSVTPGNNITYALTLSNSGPSAASAVTLSDTLPSGETFVSFTQTAGAPFACTTPAAGSGGMISCSSASMANGAVATFSLVVAIPSNAATGVTLTNTATATSSTADPGGANNTASASVAIAVVAATPMLDMRMLLLLIALLAITAWSGMAVRSR